MAAGEQAMRPQADPADGPQLVRLIEPFADPMIAVASFEFLEIDLGMRWRIILALVADAGAPIGMQPFVMHRVDRILLALAKWSSSV